MAKARMAKVQDAKLPPTLQGFGGNSVRAFNVMLERYAPVTAQKHNIKEEVVREIFEDGAFAMVAALHAAVREISNPLPSAKPSTNSNGPDTARAATRVHRSVAAVRLNNAL